MFFTQTTVREGLWPLRPDMAKAGPSWAALCMYWYLQFFRCLLFICLRQIKCIEEEVLSKLKWIENSGYKAPANSSCHQTSSST